MRHWQDRIVDHGHENPTQLLGRRSRVRRPRRLTRLPYNGKGYRMASDELPGSATPVAGKCGGKLRKAPRLVTGFFG